VKSTLRLLLLCLFVAVASPEALAQRALPSLANRVTDEVGLLPPDVRNGLEEQLRTFETTKGSQVVLVIVGSTQPEAIEQFGLRLGESRKVGRKGIDDGAIFIVALTDRKMRIEVGYGLEGVLSDATSKQILDDRVRPHFRAGNPVAGIQEGVRSILAKISGEQLPPPKSEDRTVIIVLAIIFSFLVILAFIGAMQTPYVVYPGQRRHWGRNNWGGGGWGGGSGGFSGGGGGGFSGGGGSFGGGGASSSW